jgi:hypothetical protein
MKPDVYGHCCLCHTNLLLPRVVGGKEIMMFTPDFDQTEFVLNNKSRMVVCMCKPCKASVNLSDADVHAQIMESVIAGWDMEMGSVATPEEPQAKNVEPLMQKMLLEKQEVRAPKGYKDLSILFHSEGIDDYVVQNRFKELGG